MFVTIFGSDESYKSADANGNPVYENAKQLIRGKRNLQSLYAYNKSGATIYLKVQDTADAGADKGPCTVYPISASPDFLSIAIGGGQRFEKGIYIEGFTDPECTTPAGNDLHYWAGWTAWH